MLVSRRDLGSNGGLTYVDLGDNAHLESVIWPTPWSALDSVTHLFVLFFIVCYRFAYVNYCFRAISHVSFVSMDVELALMPSLEYLLVFFKALSLLGFILCL